jgi:hypothetical protein
VEGCKITEEMLRNVWGSLWVVLGMTLEVKTSDDYDTAISLAEQEFGSRFGSRRVKLTSFFRVIPRDNMVL